MTPSSRFDPLRTALSRTHLKCPMLRVDERERSLRIDAFTEPQPLCKGDLQGVAGVLACGASDSPCVREGVYFERVRESLDVLGYRVSSSKSFVSG